MARQRAMVSIVKEKTIFERRERICEEEYIVCSATELGNTKKDITIEAGRQDDGSLRLSTVMMYISNMATWFENHLDELHSMDKLYLIKNGEERAIYECYLESYAVRVLDDNIRFGYHVMREKKIKQDDATFNLWAMLDYMITPEDIVNKMNEKEESEDLKMPY